MAATILSVNDLTQRFGAELIFSGVTFQLTERERVGLVGANGSGKSSLLKIVAGLAEAASGRVDRLTGLRVAYQAQEPNFNSERSMFDEALDAFREVRQIGQRMSELEQQMAAEADGALDALFDEYSLLSTEFEARHGYEMEFRTAQVLSGLGFPESMFEEQVNHLSGGQKTRVSLAKTLLSDPDLLLLDEPTNHLDLAALEWLEGFLREWNRAYVIISHDRYFLDRVTDRTLEMAFGGLEDYPGGYRRYLKLREERRERRRKEYEEQQEFIKRTEEFIRKYKAGQRAREAKGRETRLARLARIEAPQELPKLNLQMRASQRSGEVVLQTDKLEIGYSGPEGTTVLATSPELIIQRGDRVAIVGPNGSGKTTALRTLVGEIPALKGEMFFGTNVKPAYYAQGHEGLNRKLTALETILHDQPMGEEQARNLLGRFLFSNDDVYKTVAQLSGGERSRLALARLTLEHSNFLILDEPTNHLDILARETLEEVLNGYDGTLLFVSHDRFFIDSIANKVWAMEDGRVAPYLGNYTDMLRERERRAGPAPGAALASTEQPPEPAAKPRDNRANRGSRRGLDKELRAARKRLETAERSVASLEARLDRINDAINMATVEQDVERLAKLGTEYDVVQAELESAYSEWSEAGAQLDGLNTEAAALEASQSA